MVYPLLIDTTCMFTKTTEKERDKYRKTRATTPRSLRNQSLIFLCCCIVGP